MKVNDRSGLLIVPAVGFAMVGFAGMSLGLVTPAIANSSNSEQSAIAAAKSEVPLSEMLLSEMLLSEMPLSETLTAQAENDIVAVATASGSFNTLVQLLTELGMAEDLRGYGRFTVFAPTDAAFDAIPDEILQALAGDRELLAQVLAYHVVAERTPYYADNFSGSQSLRTLERSEITVSKRGGSLSVNGVEVVEADIEAANGVIHAIDQVLIPDSVLSQIR